MDITSTTPKLHRTRLTLSQKAEVLRRLKQGPSHSQLQNDFACSRRTICQIKAQRETIENALHTTNNASRKSFHVPRFLNIEHRLYEFVHIARSAKLPISAVTLQCKAIDIRDSLIESVQTEKEKEELVSFQASNNWVLGFTRRHAMRSIRLHGEAGSVPLSIVATGISRLREQLNDFDADCIFNMDETGLFFKLFPKRTYVLASEDRKRLRGTKDMKAKARVSVYVCTDSTGIHKVQLAIIGAAKNPRCFRKGETTVNYFSQKNAWSDSVTYRRWFLEVFMPYVRRYTSKKVALVMDNCGPHATDVLDVSGQVTIFTLPPNCTSLFQPMDMGVIATLKAKYKSKLLRKILSTVEDNKELRQAAKNMRPSMKGLDEGHDPHMLEVTELLRSAWESVSSRTVARCWTKADILPRCMQAEILAAYPASDIATDLNGLETEDAEYVSKWVSIEDDLEVKEAMVNDYLDSLYDDSGSQKEGDAVSGGASSEDDEEVSSQRAPHVTSMADVGRAFHDSEEYFEQAGVDEALYYLRKAKRVLYDVYNEGLKRRRR
ncbi:Jerky protein-like [Gracilariopsis chorda]|uniref:Jerky protein-like n=1 Tax=Gracilariopsis chorda TaxID=448386 RepID=A0A2V3J223_9FLOR|nr:Jerky protein-like [Gracilariopsis chorda]|eukprot:PXF48393.1 Jerky protein-like [Gracilariopsis chorda]